jgi:hypothetical protein
MSSVMQAGPCVRSNQLDYDEDVMYKVSKSGANSPFFKHSATLAYLPLHQFCIKTFGGINPLNSPSNISTTGYALTRRPVAPSP